MATRDTNQAAEWLQPPAEQEGLAQYVETLRQRGWIVVLATLVTLGFALLYLLSASNVYEAESNLLVTPVDNEDPTLASLGLIQASADPLRPIETAAALTTTNEVAAQAADMLGVEDGSELQDDVEAQPVAESNLVAITARAETPEGARDLANAFARAAVAHRTQELHAEVETLIPQIQDQLDATETPETRAALSSTLARLDTLAAAPTPEMRVETVADAPSSAVSPRPLVTLIGALLAGLVLGVGAAFGFQALDPTLRREEQLRRLYRLPILTRIPKDAARSDRPLSPTDLSPPTREAYRTLRGTLASPSRTAVDGSRAILVTGSAPGEGKTTTAVNLAVTLALSGNSVMLIDADLRRPAIGKLVDIEADAGIVGVLIENVSLDEAVLTPDAYAGKLQVLLAEHEGGWISELFMLPRTQTLIEEAKSRVDYVVIDSAPLTEVIDALPLTRYVDDVVVVTRIGHSRLSSIHRLAELLAENDVKPVGFAVVGSQQPSGRGYYYARQAGERRLFGPQAGDGRATPAPSDTPAARD